MHVIIGGCGRVGAQLATRLSEGGHDVAVIDKNADAFRRLGESFTGTTLRGIVFDRPTLERAGIRQAQAYVAVTSGDNSNIVSARAARHHYDVERVVARIYDPDRAVIYERLGITTIASARWTADAVMREVLPEGSAIEGSVGPGHGDVVLFSHVLPAGIRGLTPDQLNVPGESQLIAITGGGATTIPRSGVLLQGGDRLHMAVQRDALDRVRARLDAVGEEER